MYFVPSYGVVGGLLTSPLRLEIPHYLTDIPLFEVVFLCWFRTPYINLSYNTFRGEGFCGNTLTSGVPPRSGKPIPRQLLISQPT